MLADESAARYRHMIDDTARAMGTPLLLRVRDDAVKLLAFARDKSDYAAATFFDVLISHFDAEIARRETADKGAAPPTATPAAR